MGDSFLSLTTLEFYAMTTIDHLDITKSLPNNVNALNIIELYT